MRKIILIFVSILCLQNCKQTDKPNTVPAIVKENTIQGSWKLVYAHIEENDSIQVKDMSQTDFIKIINQSHFAFFNQKKESSEDFVAGGGSYTFDGKNYIETLDFINAPDYRGHVFPFNVEIKGDSLIQQGREEIKEAGVDRYILEKYIRIKSKN